MDKSTSHHTLIAHCGRVVFVGSEGCLWCGRAAVCEMILGVEYYVFVFTLRCVRVLQQTNSRHDLVELQYPTSLSRRCTLGLNAVSIFEGAR